MSNPIASETEREDDPHEPDCECAGDSDGEGNPVIHSVDCKNCDCGAAKRQTEPASDPSGKGAREWFLKLTDVPAGLHGLADMEALYDVMNKFAASLRQQLSEHEKFAREVATDLGAGNTSEACPIPDLRGLIFNLLHARKIDHDDLEGKVSQLEAERDKLKSERNANLRSGRDR